MRLVIIAFLAVCCHLTASAEHWADANGLTIDFPPGWQDTEAPQEGGVAQTLLQRRNPNGPVTIQVIRMKGHPGPTFKGLEKSGVIEGLQKNGLTLTSYENRPQPDRAQTVVIARHDSGMLMEAYFFWNDRALYKVTCVHPESAAATTWQAILDSAVLPVVAPVVLAPSTTAKPIDGHALSVRIIEIGLGGLLLALLLRKIMKS